MGNLGAGDVLAGELHAPLDFVGESVLEIVRVLLEHLAVVGGGRRCTKSAKRDFSGRKVGLNLLYDASERFKRSTVRWRQLRLLITELSNIRSEVEGDVGFSVP